jgi:hypothetical protein
LLFNLDLNEGLCFQINSLKMSKKPAVKKTTVPSMFTKNPPTTGDTQTLKEDKTKNDRLVPWVEK